MAKRRTWWGNPALRQAITLTEGGGDPILAAFADGTDGFYFDFSKTDRLFQDKIGTPADGVGEAIYLGRDGHSWGGQTLAQQIAAQPELIANPGPFANTTGITAVGSTLGVAGGILTITASASVSGRAEWALAGLTVGKVYAATIRARRSVGTGQRIHGWTCGSVPTTALTDSFADYTFDMPATATSGLLRLYASAIGVSNDAMEVESVSVKEIPGNHGLQDTGAARPTWRTGGLARFDGVDDNLQTLLTPGASITLLAKVQSTTLKAVMGARDSTETRCALFVDAGGKVGGGIGSQSITTITGGSTIAGVQVMGLTTDGSTVKLWQNGAEVYSGAQAGAVGTVRPLFVGGWNDIGTAASFLAGDIYHALAIKKALTAAQIAAITNQWGTT